MRRIAKWLLAVSCLSAAAPASAQDLGGFAGVLATLTEGFGQTFAEAAGGGQSVFVTAHGKAKLPTPPTGAYFVNVDGEAVSAVEAARLREQKLSQLRAVSQKFGVEMQLGESRFSLETDSEAQQRRNRDLIAARVARANGGAPANSPPIAIPPPEAPEKLFIARTGVRFNAPTAARLPEFLDAVRGAGVDDIRTSASGPAAGLLAMVQSQEVLGFGSVDQVSDAVWDAAGREAMAAARAQAQTLAAAAGRSVGDAKQILLLSKSLKDGDAEVAVAVRFAFAPKP